MPNRPPAELRGVTALLYLRRTPDGATRPGGSAGSLRDASGTGKSHVNDPTLEPLALFPNGDPPFMTIGPYRGLSVPSTKD